MNSQSGLILGVGVFFLGGFVRVFRPRQLLMLGTGICVRDRSSNILMPYSRGRKKGGGEEEEDAKLTTLCLKPFIVTTM